MRSMHHHVARLFTAVTLALTLTLTLMLVGCGGETSGEAGGDGAQRASTSTGSGATVEAMLQTWASGDKAGALDTLLQMNWTDPPLAEDSLLAVSNTKLAKQGDIARAAEVAKQAHEQYFKDWMALGNHALDQLDNARNAGDDARAKQIETALDDMCAFLQDPEHLGIFQRLAPALEPLAPGEIQTPAGF